MNILVVEDDAPMAMILSVLMRTISKSIEIVGTMEDAMISLATKPKPDFVMLDLGLPDSPAIQTLERIREIRARGIKVIVMTGAFLPDIFDVAIQHGANACFYKGDTDFVNWIKSAVNGVPSGSKSPFPTS